MLVLPQATILPATNHAERQISKETTNCFFILPPFSAMLSFMLPEQQLQYSAQRRACQVFSGLDVLTWFAFVLCIKTAQLKPTGI